MNSLRPLSTPGKVGNLVKKLIAMLLMAAFLFTGVVGCGDTPKDKDKAGKDTKPADTKDKAAKP